MIELLYFTCWIQTRYQKSSLLSVKMGKRAITFIKNYYPGNKIFIFDAVMRTQLPTVQISFNQVMNKCFNLNNYPGHQTQPYVQIVMQDIRILFTFQLLSNTSKIYDKCTSKSIINRLPLKIRYRKALSLLRYFISYIFQGIKDYIRSQQQFLAQFQRNQEIQQIRQLQAQQSRIQRDLCDQIMNTKKYSLQKGKIILIFIIFLFVGFLIGRHDTPKNGGLLNNLLYPFKNNQQFDDQDDQIIKKKDNKKSKTKKVLLQNSKPKKTIKEPAKGK